MPLDHEDLIDLKTAATVAPLVSGRGLSRSTLQSWAVNGVRGVKLETRFHGNKRVTSREAIARFMEAINAPAAATA
jgi:hypothetical protein